MTSRWCPSCGAEYREGFTVCADCDVRLVDTPPAPPAKVDHAHHPDNPFDPDDDTVELLCTNPAEAEVIAAHLRSEGIPALAFGVDPYSGYGMTFARTQGVRVMVRRRDAQTAAALVAEFSDD